MMLFRKKKLLNIENETENAWKKRVRLERFYREAPVKLRRADWNKRKMALEQ